MIVAVLWRPMVARADSVAALYERFGPIHVPRHRWLCLIFGIFPRLIVASAWLLINMSLTVFKWVELVGHLPLYGVMAMLLVWTPQEEDQRLWAEGVLKK